VPRHPEGGRNQEIELADSAMINLSYSLVIEATADPDFFGFYSTELEGFSGVGHSVEDCLYKARWGMEEHIELLAQQHLPVPPANPNPTVVICNEAQTAAASA
jgi:predicted RNase H-like HicB family nuclease